MKLKRPREPKKARIVIIPLIDVMFFLLVTFMLASLSMVNINSIKVNLPKGRASSFPQNNKLITISISKDQTIYVDKAPVSLDDLGAYLKTHFNKNQYVMIASDKEAPSGIMVKAMLKAQNAGFFHLLIAVKSK
ncbi:ExbD/TolR family protein [Hydrogenobaculum acidophilum]